MYDYYFIYIFFYFTKATRHAEFEAINLIVHIFNSLSMPPAQEPVLATFHADKFETIFDELLSFNERHQQLPLIEPPMCRPLLQKYVPHPILHSGPEMEHSPQYPHQLTPFFKACTLYVSCEPCIMCAAALSLIGMHYSFMDVKSIQMILFRYWESSLWMQK